MIDRFLSDTEEASEGETSTDIDSKWADGRATVQFNGDRCKGIVAAAHTPMNADGSLNLTLVEALAEHFQNSGVSGVFVAGTTGECHSLTVDERLALAVRWAEVAVNTDLHVFIQVGHNCQSSARALAEDAARLPVDAIAALSPSFLKPQSVEQLIDFLVPIAGAGSRLPFYFYDIPSLTGVHLSMTDLLRDGPARIPNLAGIKYTNDDLAQYQECMKYAEGAFHIMFGCDESLVAGLALGAQTTVGSSYAFAAPLYNRIIELHRAGNSKAARVQQAKSVAMISELSKYGYSAAAKAVMKMIGIDCGPVRPPLRELTREQCAQLRARLEELEIIAIA